MASAATQLLNAEEFHEFVLRPENEGRYFELEQGEVVELSRPGELHGVICGNVSYLLGVYVRQRKAGVVCSNDMGVILERDPDTVRGPDVALYLESSKYRELSVNFAERIPPLVVEVLSPSDRMSQTIRKIQSYFDAGVSLAWTVEPEAKTLTIWRAGKAPIVLAGDQEIDDVPELPGFRCKVSDFFYPEA